MNKIGQPQGAADKNILAQNQAVDNNNQAKTDLQQKAIQARLGGKQGGITSRGQVAAERAGFDTGSASRQQGDTQQGVNIAGTIASIFGKKG
jgi:hypothetical protein